MGLIAIQEPLPYGFPALSFASISDSFHSYQKWFGQKETYFA